MSLLHPFSDPAKPESDFVTIVRGEGSTLWDDAGKSYLDGMASLWYCQIGHGRQEMVDAISTQLAKLDAYHLFDPFSNEPAVAVAEAVVARSPMPDGRVFLGCSGSEAVDTAFKLMRLAGRFGGSDDRQIVLRRTRGYHGTNVGGTTAQGIAANREGWGDLVPHFVEIDPDDIEDAARVFAEHGERIAGVISEPLQGAGGVHPPRDGYLEGLRRLCTDHGALLCFDEVICGFGRTGSWFGAQTYGVTPDLLTFAKGVSSGYQPLSGVVVGPELAATLESLGGVLRHGYTYSGHPAACAAGLCNIEIIEREGLVERAGHIGARFTAALDALVADGTVDSFRGIGGVWAVELHDDGLPVRDRMLDNGVIVRAIEKTIIYCPPLVVTDAEIDTMIETMVAAIA